MTANNWHLSPAGIKFIIAREGSEPKMYHDIAGKPTIGVGHLLTNEERASGKLYIKGQKVHWRDGLSEQQIADLLDQDADAAENAINRAVKVSLTQNQFDALVSFVFNVGVGNFLQSTLLKKLNQGDYQAIPHQLKRWKFYDGHVSVGLINRRELESKLWLA